ncbi:glucose-methanol-choline oxidoreductase [Aspergillus luchuensis]|uniref:Glucose-methanol-choline oxidoreductase n=1 Tax=Aspergillus kawachii TaxID=1069201 RepID=A0A146FB58_ASPKA|nr:glucose-methanol-choline oxidoreductase [Aspergillus luchuensis]
MEKGKKWNIPEAGSGGQQQQQQQLTTTLIPGAAAATASATMPAHSQPREYPVAGLKEKRYLEASFGLSTFLPQFVHIEWSHQIDI